jgi:hypothetical protein
MVEVSISIVNFNTKGPLKKCLESIKKNIKGIDYEVIVADNNSCDGSVEMLKNEFGFVKLITNKENKGATVAKNQIFKEAKGEYILILDSDVEILPQTVEKMVNFMEKNPETGILGPKVLFPNGRQQHSCNKSIPNLWSSFLNKFLFFANLRYKFYRSKIGDLYLKKRYNRIEEFSWLGGMCLLVRREVINQIGGMDENFFIYYDDTDFCWRAKNMGWKIYYLPSVSVIHHLSKGVRQFSEFLYPKIFESELYFFKKHYGKSHLKVCALFIQMGMILRILISFLFLFKKNSFKKRIKVYWQVFHLAKKYFYGTN